MSLPITDNFDRSNGGLGSNWTTYTGYSAPQIVSNEAMGQTDASCAAWWNADTPGSDQYVQAKITAIGGGDDVCLFLRLNDTGADNHYGLFIMDSGVMFIKSVNGSDWSQIGSTTYEVPSVGDIVRFEAQGTTLRYKLNGTVEGSVTDSSLSSGKVGFQTWNTGVHIDDFEAGNLTTTYTASASLDALIQKTGITGTASLDALIQVARSGYVSADALIAKLSAISIDLDAIVQAVHTRSASLDAIIQAGRTGSAQIDAILQKLKTASVQLDAYLMLVSNSAVSLDSMLQTSHQGNLSLDAWLQAAKSVSVQIDALLQQVKTGSTQLDACIMLVQTTAVAIDALVSISAAHDLSIDALLQAAYVQGVSLDAIIYRQVTVTDRNLVTVPDDCRMIQISPDTRIQTVKPDYLN